LWVDQSGRGAQPARSSVFYGTAELLVALWAGCVLLSCDLVVLPECTASSDVVDRDHVIGIVT
jgi:hypothetical protein